MLCLRIFRNIPKQAIRNMSVASPRNNSVKSNTLDASEVEHHTKFADSWWDPDGPVKLLHSMNSVRIPFIRSGLVNTGKLKESEVESRPDYLNGIKLLDIGCGGGVLSIALARLGADVTGLDPGAQLIEVAKREAQSRLPAESQINFVTATIEEYEPQVREIYDVVVLSEVIEHVTKKEEFIKTSVNTLKPAGSIFFTTINRTMASWLAAIIGAEYVLEIIPKGAHDWEKFITPAELKAYLERAGCKTVQTTGLIYQPFSNEWSWSATPAILYALHAVKQP